MIGMPIRVDVFDDFHETSEGVCANHLWQLREARLFE
jgi:hypothetical protein